MKLAVTNSNAADVVPSLHFRKQSNASILGNLLLSPERLHRAREEAASAALEARTQVLFQAKDPVRLGNNDEALEDFLAVCFEGADKKVGNASVSDALNNLLSLHKCSVCAGSADQACGVTDHRTEKSNLSSESRCTFIFQEVVGCITNLVHGLLDEVSIALLELEQNGLAEAHLEISLQHCNIEERAGTDSSTRVGGATKPYDQDGKNKKSIVSLFTSPDVSLQEVFHCFYVLAHEVAVHGFEQLAFEGTRLPRSDDLAFSEGFVAEAVFSLLIDEFNRGNVNPTFWDSSFDGDAINSIREFHHLRTGPISNPSSQSQLFAQRSELIRRRKVRFGYRTYDKFEALMGKICEISPRQTVRLALILNLVGGEPRQVVWQNIQRVCNKSAAGEKPDAELVTAVQKYCQTEDPIDVLRLLICSTP